MVEPEEEEDELEDPAAEVVMLVEAAAEGEACIDEEAEEDPQTSAEAC